MLQLQLQPDSVHNYDTSLCYTYCMLYAHDQLCIQEFKTPSALEKIYVESLWNSKTDIWLAYWWVADASHIVAGFELNTSDILQSIYISLCDLLISHLYIQCNFFESK